MLSRIARRIAPLALLAASFCMFAAQPASHVHAQTCSNTIRDSKQGIVGCVQLHAGLVIAHVYFAVRPDKWWITKSMILGWITRRQYLEHHEPHRWQVDRLSGSSSAKPADQA